MRRCKQICTSLFLPDANTQMQVCFGTKTCSVDASKFVPADSFQVEVRRSEDLVRRYKQNRPQCHNGTMPLEAMPKPLRAMSSRKARWYKRQLERGNLHAASCALDMAQLGQWHLTCVDSSSDLALHAMLLFLSDCTYLPTATYSHVQM